MEYEFLRMLFDVCGISERLPFYDAIEDTQREDRAFGEVIKSVIGMILAAEIFFSL